MKKILYTTLMVLSLGVAAQIHGEERIKGFWEPEWELTLSNAGTKIQMLWMKFHEHNRLLTIHNDRLQMLNDCLQKFQRDIRFMKYAGISALSCGLLCGAWRYKDQIKQGAKCLWAKVPGWKKTKK